MLRHIASVLIIATLMTMGCDTKNTAGSEEMNKLKQENESLKSKLSEQSPKSNHAKAGNEDEGDSKIEIISYGHQYLETWPSGKFSISWRAKLKNKGAERISKMYIRYVLLDQDEGELSYDNAFENLGPSEELTITGDCLIEPRLYSQVKKVGIAIRYGSVKTYKIFPAKTSS